MPKKWIITRYYKCKSCNQDCTLLEESSRPFRRRCPNCNKNTLLLESGDCGITTVVDMKKPKTLGSLGEKNFREAQKNGTLPKDYKKKKKTKKGILKNPGKYIEEGHI